MLQKCSDLHLLDDFSIKLIFGKYLGLCSESDVDLRFHCTILIEFIQKYYKHCTDLQLPVKEILTKLVERIDLIEVQELLASYLVHINYYDKDDANVGDTWTNPFNYSIKFDKEINNTYSIILLDKIDPYGMQDVLLAYNKSTYLKPAYLHIIFKSDIEHYFSNDAVVLLDILNSDYGREEDSKMHNWISVCLSKFNSKPLVNIW